MQIESSTGGTVNITLIGVADVANMLFQVSNDIKTLANEQLLRSAALAAYEVQQSIMGQRGEPKSVDTGNFANSIQTAPVGDDSVSVYSDVEYAKYLEYGTSRMEPRAHFQNTAFRIEPVLNEDFKAVITKVCEQAKK